ncbi:hypothetical protein [Streptomyces roseicoloratus]|uniref:hypothetical protein n=1 Tax=Streptomyces roseicoloratus TaxID=2508722 RepID=UPI0013E99222|nr:hypothetical protein [Streptomyces roseicoloratus]
MTNRSVSDPTTGTVTLTDVLPQGLTVNSTHSHASWDCDVSLSSVTCTNDTVVQPFQSYPLLELNVNVAEDAPCTVTNTVTLSGGGSDAASASDSTTITGGDCDTPAPVPDEGNGSILPIDLGGVLTMFNNISTNNNINSPGASNSSRR